MKLILVILAIVWLLGAVKCLRMAFCRRNWHGDFLAQTIMSVFWPVMLLIGGCIYLWFLVGFLWEWYWEV